MSVTKFRFSKLPEIVSCLLKDASDPLAPVYNPVAVNQEILIEDEGNILFKNTSLLKGENLDTVNIEVFDGSKWSSSAIVNIHDLVSINTSQATDEVIVAANNSTYMPYDLSKININNSTDRIKINTISGLGKFTLDGVSVVIGDVIPLKKLPQLKAETFNGTGSPYASITFFCGNHIGYNENTSYSLSLNIISLAELSLTAFYGTNPYEEVLAIKKGLSNQKALVTLTSSGSLLTSNDGSSVVVDHNQNSITITANGSQDILVDLDSKGEANIFVTHNYSGTGIKTSSLALEIKEVQNDTSNVSSIKTHTSTINFN